MVSASQNDEGKHDYSHKTIELPYLQEGQYKSHQNKQVIDDVKHMLNEKDFYEPIDLDIYFTGNRGFH